MQVLPSHVPAPLVAFAWEEVSAIPYAPAAGALHEASWLTASAYRGAAEEPQALAGASSDDFEWALSVRAPTRMRMRMATRHAWPRLPRAAAAAAPMHPLALLSCRLPPSEPTTALGIVRRAVHACLQVVHSRTFANAAARGGVGVRMLCPLVDMLNHAGDEARGPGASGGLAGPRVAMDNVR